MSRIETRQKVFERKLKEDLDKVTGSGGFVYVCVNNAWPRVSKIGCTKNPLDRIKSFSTYDPYDEYKLVGYRLVDKMFEEEKFYHTLFKNFRLNGEWFDIDWPVVVGCLHSPEKADSILKLHLSRVRSNKPKLINEDRMVKIVKNKLT